MISLQLSEVTAAALSARAAAQGLSVEAYLKNILLSTPAGAAPRLSLDEMDRLLDEEATSGPSPVGSFPRAELYGDHD
jgi:plasmid stability protein